MERQELIFAVSQVLDSKLTPMFRKQDRLENSQDRMHGSVDRLDGNLDRILSRLGRMEGRLEQIEIRLNEKERETDQMNGPGNQIETLYYDDINRKIKQISKKD